jgi:hypothetical protein
MRGTVDSFLQVPFSLGLDIQGTQRAMENFIVDAGQNRETSDLCSVCAALSVQLQAWMSRQSLSALSPVQPHHWRMLWQFMRQVTANGRSCVLDNIAQFDEEGD